MSGHTFILFDHIEFTIEGPLHRVKIKPRQEFQPESQAHLSSLWCFFVFFKLKRSFIADFET